MKGWSGGENERVEGIRMKRVNYDNISHGSPK